VSNSDEIRMRLRNRLECMMCDLERNRDLGTLAEFVE
jgi:hypothetical protein